MSKHQLCCIVAFVMVLSGTGSVATSTRDAVAATTASQKSASTLVSQSGQAAPAGDLPGWKQVFSDDFTTNVPLGGFPGALGGRWGGYAYPGKDTHSGTYWPEKVVSVHDGVMDLFLHTENNLHLSAAPIPKLPGRSPANGMLYGRYAVRFRSDPIPGYKTAWLLWPDSGVWPRDGEIDFPEAGLDDPICAFMHRLGGGGQDVYCSGATYPAWHTAVIEWTPQRLTFVLDDRVIGTSTSSVPNTPMHWVLQTETNTVPPANSAAGHVLIDWVSVYRPDASAGSVAPPPAPVQPAAAAADSVAPGPTAPDWSGGRPITSSHIRWFDAHVAQLQSPWRNEPAAMGDPWPEWPQLLERVQGSVRGLVVFAVVDVAKRGLDLGLEVVRQGLQRVGDLVHGASHVFGLGTTLSSYDHCVWGLGCRTPST